MKTRRAIKRSVKPVDAAGMMRRLESMRPRDADALHRFVQRVLGLKVLRQARVAGHAAPFDYLCAAFFESDGRQPDRPWASGGDLVVWASRGGGKTLLGAAATMLDMLFKPGVQVCILGGSMHQSSRMYEYLRGMAERRAIRGLLRREPTGRTIELINGSRTRLLSHSPRMVRGEHIHKLRCDEVDEFQEHVLRAAQMVTQSATLGGRPVRGSIEMLSTMHKPLGPMSRALERATGGDGVRVMRWSVLDVMARCEPERDCDSCILLPDCGGMAKESSGYLAVEDVIAIRRRSSDATWRAEMLCERPRLDASVYPQFDPVVGGRHVFASESSLLTRHPPRQGVFVCGIDFGIRSQFVALLARLTPANAVSAAHAARQPEQVVEVIDEYVETGRTLEQNLLALRERQWPALSWTGVDPAGGQRNSQTGRTDIQLLRRHGMTVRHARASVEQGIEAVRRRLDQGLLRIDAGCTRLLQAMQTYRFDADRPSDPRPMKEGPQGPDHACDALRYLVINLDQGVHPVRRGVW